jgi:hypothetical protein
MDMLDMDGFKLFFAEIIIHALKDLSLKPHNLHRISAENFLDDSPQLRLYLDFLYGGEYSDTITDCIIAYLKQRVQLSRESRAALDEYGHTPAVDGAVAKLHEMQFQQPQVPIIAIFRQNFS